MKHVTMLIIGMLLLVLGAQSAIRLLADHDNAGLLGWLPGGFPVWLACYAVAAVAGALLASRGSKQAKQGDRGQ
jgi:hypothetical protein